VSGDIDAAVKYIENVIELDFGASLDELTAMIFMVAGPVPAMKPFNVMSTWKTRASTALIQYTQGRPAHAHVGRYASIAVLYLLRRKQAVVPSRWPTRLGDGWQVEYMRQIKAVRRIEAKSLHSV
jgi:hypothetical protein